MQNVWRFLAGTLLTLTLTQCSDDDGPEASSVRLTISEAENVTRSTADVSGSIEIVGGKASKCGFLYSTSQADLTTSNKSEAHEASVNGTSGQVKAHLEGLTPGATYYYCLYAQSGVSRVISDILNFTTHSNDAPTLSAVKLVESTEYTLTLRCSILSDGGTPLIQYGYQYRKMTESEWSSTDTPGFDEEDSTTFTVTIKDLQAATDYVVRAVAQNSAGFAYSDELTCTTAALTSPVLTLYTDQCSYGSDYVKVFAKIENYGASDKILERGFCWSTTDGEPIVSDNKLVADTTNDEFSATITGLSQNTTYYVRAYASNEVDGKTMYGYSKEVAIITTDHERLPEFGKIIVEPTYNSVYVSCNLSYLGNVAIVERGFCWSRTSKSPQLSDNVVNVDTDDADFHATIEGLVENTTYYIVAYIKYISGGKDNTLYSSVSSFSIQQREKPQIDYLSTSDITESSFTIRAWLKYSGDSEVTEVGFCWTLDKEVAADTLTKHKATLGTDNYFTLNVTELSIGATYYVYGYATNEAGTGFSSVKEVTLLKAPTDDDNLSPDK